MRRLDRRSRPARPGSRAAAAALAASICVARHAGGLADRLEPGRGAVDADRAGADDRAAGGVELADRWRCRRDAPRRPRRSRARHRGRATRAPAPAAPAARPIGSSSAPMPTGSAGNISPIRVTRGLVGSTGCAGAAPGPASASRARVAQHGAGQHVLGLGMGRHAEARHVDADDAHAVDLASAAGRSGTPEAVGHAEVDDDDGVVVVGLGDARCTASRMSSNSLPVTSVSELNGT